MENKIMLLNDLDSILSMAQCYMFNKEKRASKACNIGHSALVIDGAPFGQKTMVKQ